MMEPRNNAPNTRGRPFAPGNPGRPKGARNTATLAAQTLLDGEAEAVTRKCVELAKAGDTTALRLCLERILPPRKAHPVSLDLPAIDTAADVSAALSEVAAAMAHGQITPDEAMTVVGVIEAKRKAIELTELTARIERLERLGEAGH